MNTKTTAVEYLFEKLWESPKDKLTWNAILEQAKQMEKEQIENAYIQGFAECDATGIMDVEQYYKKKYDK
jgi:hypothetical protein